MQTKQCHLHDYMTAQCPRCLHREYIFPKGKGVSPEELLSCGTEVRCEFCGAQCVTVPKVTQLCKCKRCEGRRRMMEDMGEQIKEGFDCRCE